MAEETFEGFSSAAWVFLSDLKNNNTREWFAAHKPLYDADLKAPADAFAGVMASALSAMTELDHSAKVFRIYRDVRFSKDKTPYNPHLRIGFTPDTPATNRPMWFFGVDPQGFALGTGVFAFDKDALSAFRARVAGPDGKALAAMIDGLRNAGARISEPDLKRVPTGYPQDQNHGDLLRHKGLSAWRDFDDPGRLTRPDTVEFCLSEFTKIRPLFDALLS